MNTIKYIDLFAGAGGLSEGFKKSGYLPVAHVEFDKAACYTLKTRLSYYFLIENNKEETYLSYLKGDITREELYASVPSKLLDTVINAEIGKDNKKIFSKIDNYIEDSEIDLIIGGPPCQAYSLVGRARDANKMQNDPRNYLYKEYVKFLKRYKPKVFVFENVQGLKTASGGKYLNDMLKSFERAGYIAKFEVQNAADFGVLQNRKRMILIGWKKDIYFEYPEFHKKRASWKINDLFLDLKKLRPGEQNNITKYKNGGSNYLKEYGLRNGIDFVTQHITRPHNERDLEIYEIAIKKWLEEGERLQYADLPERLKTHKNESAFTDRFKVVNPKGYSHTMVAHIAKDGHYYIYPDLNQIRSLSVREAARIQSFPDDFFFEGGRSAAFRQIGNAVPPLMAKEIAEKIILYIL